jgi:acyl-CoA thioester hydrolase
MNEERKRPSPLVGEGRERGAGADLGSVGADTPLSNSPPESNSPPPQVRRARLAQDDADLEQARDQGGRGQVASWPHLSGRAEGGTHRLPVRVYYEDTDFSGLVYHASYLRFLERGRTDSLRLAGADQSRLHAEGDLVFAVRRMTIDFLKPARMDDVLVIETRTEEVRGATILIKQRVLRGDDVLVTADVMVACIGGGRPRRIPDALREQLAPPPLAGETLRRS